MSSKIVHQTVKSSNVDSVGYDPEGKYLEVKFKNGGLYRYSNVPKAIAEGLMKADSVGRYFAAHVKGSFSVKKIEKGME